MEEIDTARNDIEHLNEVFAERLGQANWYTTSVPGDRDRLFQTVRDVLSFLFSKKGAANDTTVDRSYPDQTNFDKDASHILEAKDLWTGRWLSELEELARMFQVHRNTVAGRNIAIGRWQDTSHTGTVAALGLLSEYTSSGILDSEIWAQSFNDAFIKALVQRGEQVLLVSVLKPYSRTDIAHASEQGMHLRCGLRDDNIEIVDGKPNSAMVAWTLQEAMCLKRYGFFACPDVKYGIKLVALNSAVQREAQRNASILDLHLIALQTKLMQAIDNVMGTTHLQTTILKFLTPNIRDASLYLAYQSAWASGLRTSGFLEAVGPGLNIRRTDLRIAGAIANFHSREAQSREFYSRTAQDLSNAVRFTADRILALRYTADEIILAHFIFDHYVSVSVWGERLDDFPFRTYQSIEE